MRVLLDTSVLVAALVRTHPRHEACRRCLARCKGGETELILAAHSLAELHSVLTTLPVRPRISSQTALRLAEENRLRPRPQGLAEVIALSAADYVAVVASMADHALAGGVIYDALIAKAAEVAEVDELVTLNPNDFRRAWPAGATRIREPA